MMRGCHAGEKCWPPPDLIFLRTLAFSILGSQNKLTFNSGLYTLVSAVVTFFRMVLQASPMMEGRSM